MATVIIFLAAYTAVNYVPQLASFFPNFLAAYTAVNFLVALPALDLVFLSCLYGSEPGMR